MRHKRTVGWLDGTLETRETFEPKRLAYWWDDETTVRSKLVTLLWLLSAYEDLLEPFSARTILIYVKRASQCMTCWKWNKRIKKYNFCSQNFEFFCLFSGVEKDLLRTSLFLFLKDDMKGGGDGIKQVNNVIIWDIIQIFC